jgi:hypothetical protein
VTIKGATKPEADMQTGRLRPGLIYHVDSSSVFAFGGTAENGDAMRTATKFSFPNPDNFMARRRAAGVWEPLPDMSCPRADFNPCLFAGFIYLAGGGHRSIEAYDPATCQLKHHQPREEVDSDISILVAHMDRLVMIGGAKVYRRSDSQSRIVDERMRIGGPGWSNQTPVVAEDAVYTVVMTSGGFSLFKLGVHSGRVVAERRFS